MTASEEKRQLIETVLENIQRAAGLDEREDLAAVSVEKWTEWYETTIPLVTSVEIAAGAMRVELIKRQGMRLLAQGTQSGEALCPGKRASQREHDHRWQARILGRDPVAVDEYIQTEAKAGRTPTRGGAVRHVQERRSTKPKPSPRVQSREEAQWAMAQRRHHEKGQEILASLEKVADGQRRSDAQLHRMVGAVDTYLQRVQLIPWLTIDRTRAGTIFTINPGLRELCERETPHPALDGQSIREFLAHLRGEIVRRRKANHDEMYRVRWSTDAILSKEQTNLLNWIETYLERIP